MLRGEVPYIVYLTISIVMLVLGVVLGYVFGSYIYRTKIGSLDEYAKKKREEAEREIQAEKREQKIQLKEEVERKQGELENKFRLKQKELQEIEGRLIRKEEAADRKFLTLEKKEKELSYKEKELSQKEQELKGSAQKIDHELSRVAGLSIEEARQIILDRMDKALEHEYAKKISEKEEDLREAVERKSKEILSGAMEKCAADYVSETTVSVVPLPSDEIKGRIIGREGRNIRTFETLTGVDILVDDTPEAVTLSCFDPIRREVARKGLEHLIIDGRIHPARIEEFVQEAEKEVEQNLLKEAEDVLVSLSVHNIPIELKKLIGKMKFRTSYGQNLMRHSIEVATIAGILASELGENPALTRRAGLLHDIGKVMASEIEGPHALIGADLLKRYNEDPAVVHAVSAHHNEVKPETILDVIIQIADTVSATRPGARRENLELYIKRLEDIEKIAMSVKGVKKAYVVQAGRELRIMVNPEDVGEEKALTISHDVAKQIEEEVVYPGIIKVTVVRETRYIDYAK